jgi:hypothetical protein
VASHAQSRIAPSFACLLCLETWSSSSTHWFSLYRLERARTGRRAVRARHCRHDIRARSCHAHLSFLPSLWCLACLRVWVSCRHDLTADEYLVRAKRLLGRRHALAAAPACTWLCLSGAPMTTNLTLGASLGRRRAIAALTRVCRGWRTLAHRRLAPPHHHHRRRALSG